MFARIYRPAKIATQSGAAKTRNWVLVFASEARPTLDPLMGWTGSSDMRSQVRLTFDDRESAERYARENGIAYRVEEPRSRTAHYSGTRIRIQFFVRTSGGVDALEPVFPWPGRPHSSMEERRTSNP